MSESENPRERARKLRQQQTAAEDKLWQKLRAKRLDGFKFLRQFPIGPYFADLCCVRRRLIVEIDGGQHVEEVKAYDQERTAYLTECRFRVIRFWNHEVLRNIDSVLERIHEELQNS